MAKRTTKQDRADTALALGYLLAESLANPDESLKGFDVVVLERAFYDALKAAAKPADRGGIEDIYQDPKARRLYTAKCMARVARQFNVIIELAPDRADAAIAKARLMAA